jgi:hypothetical protein
MPAVEWILVLLLMVPAVLVYWAFHKSGVLRRTRDQLRILRPAVRRRVWTMLLAMTAVGVALGAVLVWAFSTNHAVIGLTILVGCVVLNAIVTPLLRARRVQRTPACTSSEAKRSP